MKRKRARSGPQRRSFAEIGENVVTESAVMLPPFDGKVGTLDEDWVDENLGGYLADSTA